MLTLVALGMLKQLKLHYLSDLRLLRHTSLRRLFRSALRRSRFILFFRAALKTGHALDVLRNTIKHSGVFVLAVSPSQSTVMRSHDSRDVPSHSEWSQTEYRKPG